MVSEEIPLVDDALEEAFLGAVGRLEVVRAVDVPGADQEAQDVATERREAVRRMFMAGLLTEEEATADLERLAATILTLERQVEGEGVEYVSTGQTFSELWDGADLAGRRALLEQSGVVIELEQGRRGDRSRVQCHWQ